MSKVKLAIIGNGMVGHRFIEDLLDKADASQFDITVFCEEPRKAYDRVHLSSYFSHHTAEELSLVREGYYEKHGVNVLVGERAITINRQEKVIHSSAGRTVYYDKLIMATGSYRGSRPLKAPKPRIALFTAPLKTSTPLNPAPVAANVVRWSAVACSVWKPPAH
jgi:nitrite reductase (NADH) large subunit